MEAAEEDDPCPSSPTSRLAFAAFNAVIPVPLLREVVVSPGAVWPLREGRHLPTPAPQTVAAFMLEELQQPRNDGCGRGPEGVGGGDATDLEMENLFPRGRRLFREKFEVLSGSKPLTNREVAQRDQLRLRTLAKSHAEHANKMQTLYTTESHLWARECYPPLPPIATPR